MTHGSVEWPLIDEHAGWSGWLKVDVRTFQLPDGRRADFEVLTGAAEVVSVVALTPEDEVVLARQFRWGPGAVLDELPGGVVDPGESPLEAGARELLEETGYAGRCEVAGWTWTTAASITRRFCVVARDCQRVAEPAPETNEWIDTVLVSLSEFRAHLRGGQLTDVGLGYLALDHLGLLT